jgi:hypothetical protein
MLKIVRIHVCVKLEKLCFGWIGSWSFLQQTGILMVVAPPKGFSATPQYLLKRTLLLKLHWLLDAAKVGMDSRAVYTKRFSRPARHHLIIRIASQCHVVPDGIVSSRTVSCHAGRHRVVPDGILLRRTASCHAGSDINVRLCR